VTLPDELNFTIKGHVTELDEGKLYDEDDAVVFMLFKFTFPEL
jgi:hypothetical protein